ncbi:MAG: PqqD family protein [Candidatus Brocadiales bacterium]|nr:PqqD family protein [Candidatus Brocadiales bacterium]
MEINENFVPVTKEYVEIEELDDGCILYDTEKDEVHSLNSTAASVWICCDGKHSIKEIVDVLEKCFKSESKPVQRDIIKIIKDFSKKELLTP